MRNTFTTSRPSRTQDVEEQTATAREELQGKPCLPGRARYQEKRTFIRTIEDMGDFSNSGS